MKYYDHRLISSVPILSTRVEVGRCPFPVSMRHKTLILGSCFADNIGGLMSNYGFDVLVNPLGTMYNPASIAQTLARIDGGLSFSDGDCVPVGAGDTRICSHSLHTRLARSSVQQFLLDANRALREAHEFWLSADNLIVTLGTSWVFRLASSGSVVANCLKRPAVEFSRVALSVLECQNELEAIVKLAGRRNVVFTISPIRHLADGLHGNTLSKATLMLALESVLSQSCCSNVAYFPSYEIVMDELRDYRFYADDMVHVSSLAEGYIFDRFVDFALPSDEFALLKEGIKAFRRSNHIDVSR